MTHHLSDRQLLDLVYTELHEVRDSVNRLGHVVSQQLEKIMTTQAELKAKLDAVLANVADLPTKIQGIEQVLDNLAGEVKKLKDLLANTQNDVDPAIVAQVDGIDAAITTGKQRILDDINKNTQPEQPVTGASRTGQIPLPGALQR